LQSMRETMFHQFAPIAKLNLTKFSVNNCRVYSGNGISIFVLIANQYLAFHTEKVFGWGNSNLMVHKKFNSGGIL
jgi:S-adenosylmethionine/arginine decarboxylase-like enzyme